MANHQPGLKDALSPEAQLRRAPALDGIGASPEHASSEAAAAPKARSSPSVRVLMTVHDRRVTTLACLDQVEAQRADAPAELGVVLVDDGCTDGTAEAVRARFAGVEVVTGSGQLYWNGGMRLAFQVAQRSDPDFYLLLNDDTHLRPGALRTMLETHAERTRATDRPCLVIGSTLDPATGQQSYGGWRRGGRLNPVRLSPVLPGPAPVACDTMHGNCVLIPREVVQRIGILDAAYTHRMGDLDYGFRAVRAGCGLWLAPGYLAECEANSGAGLFVDQTLSTREQWRRLVGPKGLPPSEWLTFTSRHAGPLWPLNFGWPYLKLWLNGLRRRAAPPGSR